MNDPELELERYYAALDHSPTADVEARVMRAVTAARPPVLSGRRLALLAASLVIAVAVGWAVHRPPAAPPRAAQEPKPEEIAARVNGEPVLWKDVHERFKDVKPSDVTDALRKSALKMELERVIIRQFVARRNLTVTDAELEESIRREVKMYGTVEEFEKVCRIRYGTLTKYREDRRQELLAMKAFQYMIRFWSTDPDLKDVALRPEEVPEAESRKFYEANPQMFQAVERISFMRVGLEFLNPGEEETQRALLESVRRKVEAGAEFSMLVFTYSTVGRAKNFRDLGVSRKDLERNYAPETIRYLFDELKEGEISPILKDGRTLNLFKMEQKINQKAETFEEAQGKIRNMMENRIRDENRTKLRNRLWKMARIEPADLFEED
jgi:hypothetical protein